MRVVCCKKYVELGGLLVRVKDSVILMVFVVGFGKVYLVFVFVLD